jgi:hypothetical protein
MCHKLKNLRVEFRETSKACDIGLISLFLVGVFTRFNRAFVTTQNISNVRIPQIGKSTSGVWESSNLVEVDLSSYSQLGCLPYLIMHLSQFKTFPFIKCHKLENLPMEFRKLQKLMTFHLSGCSQLGCLLDSIMHLSQSKTIQLY